MADRAGAHWFVVPPLDGPITGGTRYNAALIGALRARGVAASAVEPEAARAFARRSESTRGGRLWVDSLCLELVPELAEQTRGCMSVGLIAHYLPTLVARGGSAPLAELSELERRALEQAEAVLVTGRYMRDELRALELRAPIWLVEPGSELSPRARVEHEGLKAVMIANLLPGKGVASFLGALAAELTGSDHLELTIVGSDALDAPYAARCRELAAGAQLAARVRFTGALEHELAMAELGAADVLISASVMESYGMALREARTLGVPILARAGGNVARFVEPDSGGELVTSDEALARACVALARDAELCGVRQALARKTALPVRSWVSAAQDFVRLATGA